MNKDKQTEIVTKPFKSSIEAFEGILDEDALEMIKTRAWYWQYKQETAKLYPESYLQGSNFSKLSQEEKTGIEKMLKSEDEQNPAGKMIERFLYDCFLEIGAYIYPERETRLSKLIIEATRDNTTKERREEIESTIKGDEKLNLSMFVRGLTRFSFEKIASLTNELEQNETYLKITGSKPLKSLEKENTGLYALGVSTRQTIDILAEYENLLKEYINSYTYRLEEYGFKFIKNYTTDRELQQIRETNGTTITDIPEFSLDTTLQGYAGALRPYRPTTNKAEKKKPNLAGLLPIGEYATEHGLLDVTTIENGRLFDVSKNDITRDFSVNLSRGKLQGTIRGAIYDYELITIGLSILRALLENGEEINPERVITVDQKTLISRLYGEKNKYHLEKAGEIAQRIRAVDAGTMGVIRTIRPGGKEFYAYYPVIVFTGLDEEQQTLSFMLPYHNQLLKRLEVDKKLIAEHNKEFNNEHKNSKRTQKKEEDPEKIALFHDYNLPSLSYARNPIAAAIVKEITQLIARSGYQEMNAKGVKWTTYKVDRTKPKHPRDIIPRLGVDELIYRIPELEKRIKESKNATRYLNELFSCVWEYLKERTTVKEKYPAIKFPGWNMDEVKDLKNEDRKKWIPTKRSIKSGHIFYFEILTKEEQLKKQSEKK